MEKQMLPSSTAGAGELYELRCYHIAPGRMPDMQRRLKNDLVPLFEKHGILMKGAWESQTSDGMPLFVYLVKYSSYEVRTSSWSAFYADPQWHEARARTNAGSDLVIRTDLYLVRAHVWTSRAIDDSHFELMLLSVPIGKTQEIVSELHGDVSGPFAAHEGSVAFVFENLFGAGLPALLIGVTLGQNPVLTEPGEIVKNLCVKQSLHMKKISVD